MFYVSMDECLIFQRLTDQERIILVAMDHLDQDEDSEEADADADADAEDD
jgi:hypothetical protein